MAYFPNIFAGSEHVSDQVLMKTINFTNRERIMIGDDSKIFIEYLQEKLPEANYFSS